MSLPKPSGAFEWVQESWGHALECVPLAEVAAHRFTTRDLPLKGVKDEDTSDWDALASALGVPLDRLVRLRQVHGAAVFEARGSAVTFEPYDQWPEADAAMTDSSGVALSVRVADCVPTLIADRDSGAVAAIHAGWRGTAAGAVLVAVGALRSRYGSRPSSLVAAVGPSIGPCCYEVSPDLVPHFANHPDAAAWFSTDEKPHLDLWRATRDQLQRAGISPAAIYACELCTSHNPTLFHSYRRDGARAGRLVAAIRSGRGMKP